VTLHEDEIDISDESVRELIGSQFPEWAQKQILRIRSSGTVNAIFRIGEEFAAHQTVNHSDDEYVNPVNGATTNMAEGFFSQLKRSIDGTHHHISKEHLPRYLTEFDYRYSTRTMTDTARMARLMGQVDGRRLSYKRVKGT